MFWFARELAPLLDYQDRRNFLQVIDKSRTACERAGYPVQDHFGEVTKMVSLGSGHFRRPKQVPSNAGEHKRNWRDEEIRGQF